MNSFLLSAARQIYPRHVLIHPFNPFMPTVPTFAVRETNVFRQNGAPEVPPLCRETSVSRTANVGTVGKNRLRAKNLRAM